MGCVDPAPLPERPNRILVVDDEAVFRGVLAKELTRKGWRVEEAADGAEALGKLASRAYDVVLLDLNMPRLGGMETLRAAKDRDIDAEVIVLTGQGTIPSAIEAIRAGAYDYLMKPCETEEVDAIARRAAEKTRLARDNRILRRAAGEEEPGLAGESPAIQALRGLAAKAARAEASVLILGESGSGKELVAREIHRLGPRSASPLVAVNCAALSGPLLESELFGHERGAFTGADRGRAGLFEAADGGTLFLDEIAEMSAELQARLLRAVQFGEIRRVGSDAARIVSVRVLSATHRDLEKGIAAGTFRQDLYYRLQGIVVRVPPLRERAEDIPLLARRFLSDLRRQGRDVPADFSAGALKVLGCHPWPGNVRELKNLVERLSFVCGGERIQEVDVVAALHVKGPSPSLPELPDSLDEAEKAQIARVLAACGGKKPLAAERLGVSLKTLYNKLQKHGL